MAVLTLTPRASRAQTPAFTYQAASPQETAAFAKILAPHLAAPLRVYLRGALGAGKTFFVQNLLAAMGETGRVRSPSYALVYSYQLPPPPPLTVHHFDYYRLQGAPAGDDMLELLNDEHAVCLVEWSEQASGLPPPDVTLHLEIIPSAENPADDNARNIHCQANGAAGRRLLERLGSNLANIAAATATT